MFPTLENTNCNRLSFRNTFVIHGTSKMPQASHICSETKLASIMVLLVTQKVVHLNLVECVGVLRWSSERKNGELWNRIQKTTARELACPRSSTICDLFARSRWLNTKARYKRPLPSHLSQLHICLACGFISIFTKHSIVSAHNIKQQLRTFLWWKIAWTQWSFAFVICSE